MKPVTRFTRKMLTIFTALSMMTLGAASSVSAAAPYSGMDPEYSRELLLPPSQTGRPAVWTNTLPNALASYFTFVPMSAADATTAGFPGALGCGVGGGTTSDCYVITAKEFKQAMSLDYLKYVLGTNLFPGPNNLLDAAGAPMADTSGNLANFAAVSKLTTAWGFGSGGAGWNLFGTPITGSAPANFAAVPFDQYFTFGGGTDTGLWHFPAPTIKGVKGRPIHIKWLNQLPNHMIEGTDPTIDCGTVALYCYPYNRIVTHVHGAHVGPESDGLTSAWYTPNFALYGEGRFPNSSYANSATVNTDGPIYSYPMDQEAATIWYHDHAMGTTHTNTNKGMAGFLPITDAVEQALQTPSGNPLLPVLPTGNYELGFALQDRNFDLTGEMRMPDYGIYDKSGMSGACALDPITNLPIPGQCPRLHFMKVGIASDWHFQPYVFATAKAAGNVALNFPAGAPATDPLVDPAPAACVNLNTPFELAAQCAPFPATSATLEYFGNMPVVNGVVYGNYNVEPTVYRMRFIGGTDSRAFIMQLVKGSPVPTVVPCGGGNCDIYSPADIIPFYQIGSEQGLLINPVLRDDIDIMPGERIDVLVDFTGLTPGTVVTMKNLGDDAPYSGRFDFDSTNQVNRQPTSVNIPEIMKFTVGAFTAASAKTPSLATTLRAPYAFPGTPVDKTATPRVISLMEITDQYGRTMPTIDARGFMGPGIRTTEIIKTGDLEQWDLVNTTVDAHPMHLHQVAFRTIDRQALLIDPTLGTTVDSATGFRVPASFPIVTPLPNGNRLGGVFAPAQYVPDGASAAQAAPLWEAGWKDTVQCPPGYVTRVQALFDIIGDYVWHCHILSHEEHDMMRPFRVVAAQLAAPATVTVAPVATGGNVSVTVAAVTGAAQYVVQYRKVGDTFWTTNTASTATQNVSLLAVGLGTYEFRAQVVDPAVLSAATTLADSAWVAGGTSTYTNNVPTSGTLTPNLASPQIKGASIVMTATAAGGTGTPYQYEFWRKNPAGAWSIVQAYSTTSTYTWNTATTAPGAYQLGVHIRNQGKTSFIDVAPYVNYTITTRLPASGTLTPNLASPQIKGTSIVMTATATGGTGTPYEYEFWRKNPAGSWSIVQAYSTTSTYTWNTATAAAGAYQLGVHIRNQGQTAYIDVVPYVDYTITTRLPASGTLTPNLASPQIKGTSILMTATATGGTGTPYEYEFWRKNPAGAWSIVQAYSTTSTYTWNTATTAAGAYQLGVHIRNQGQTAFIDVVPYVDYTITTRLPASGTLTPNLASPQIKGASIVMTATATGGTGTPYQYEFWRKSPAGAWSIVQAYSTTSTYTWNTATTAAGAYQLGVHIRNQGQTAFIDVLPYVDYTVSP